MNSAGKRRATQLVPIFRSSVKSECTDDEISRQQFPLILAWALTHWKAQGMTLRRCRVRLGERTASSPGIGFVSVTRVKHPSHLVFDKDLPEYEKFQEAQWKRNFRERRRFEWRLEAKASRTLRKYGYCEADAWTREEASVAESLLNLVAQDTRMRRMRLGKEGDPNAWCWDTEELPLEEELLRHAQELVRQEGLNGDEAERVAARLLGPWHRCAVLEAFGCLIPREFHPKYDSRKPKGKICVDDMQVGVCVDAGGWKVDIFEERVLCEVGSGSSGRLSKSVLEFFLIVLRRIAEKLDLPVAVGTHALGRAVDEFTNESLLKLTVRTWKSWAWLSERIGSAKQFLLPVIRDEGKYPRDVVLLVVSAISDGVTLGNAQQFEVRVFDVLGRSGVAEKLVRNVVAVLSTISDMSGVQDAPVMIQESLPACSCAFDRGFLVLGMLLVFLARSAGKKFHESAEAEAGNPVFAAKVRKSLAALFASLRSEADRSGSRDVLLQLKNKAECVQRLELLCAAQVVDDESVLPRSTAPSGTSKSAREIAVSDFQPLKVLTWNLSLIHI